MVDQVANLAGILRRPRIAYFSMEIALADAIPTYSGGLGVLAGDTVRTAAERPFQVVFGGKAHPSDTEGWADIARNAIALNASSFNTYRMMRRYATEAYLS